MGKFIAFALDHRVSGRRSEGVSTPAFVGADSPARGGVSGWLAAFVVLAGLPAFGYIGPAPATLASQDCIGRPLAAISTRPASNVLP
jgi:hypothetical protein